MKKNILGQSLFEVVLALGLVALIITAVVAVASLSIGNISFSKSQTTASRYIEGTLEWLRSERNQSWEVFSSQAATTTWCIPELSWTEAKVGYCQTGDVVSDTVLKREIDFASISPTEIQVLVRVYWQDKGGYHEASSVTSFTDQR